jgi:hypothetical protein
MKDQIMTREELRVYLGVDIKTVDRAIKDGMPSYKIGAAVRIPLNRAVEWMGNRARKSATKKGE